MTSGQWQTVPGSRMALTNWYLPLATFIWCAPIAVAILAGRSIGGVGGSLLLLAGILLSAACLWFLLSSIRSRVQVLGHQVRFIGRWSSTTIDLRAVTHFSKELDGDLIAEIYSVRSLTPDPELFHIEVEHTDGTFEAFEQNCGLPRAAERTVKQLNERLRCERRQR